MEFIISNEIGHQVGFLRMPYSFDIEIGNKSDFQLTVSAAEWAKSGYGFDYQFFIPNTEIGGIFKSIKSIEKTGKLQIEGSTWRGMLMKKIIQPPVGADYLTVSGEANGVLKSLIESEFGGLFKVSAENSGIDIKTFSFDRYVGLLSGITKMLNSANARLDIRYKEGETGGSGFVEIKAVPIKEINEELSEDAKIFFSTVDFRGGINHLICLGKGELQNRLVVHLYSDKDGNISRSQTFIGADERVATYDYSNASDETELTKKGSERFRTLMNYKEFSTEIDEAIAEIGDVVIGREFLTGFEIKQPVTQKIVRANNGDFRIQFRVGGKIKK